MTDNTPQYYSQMQAAEAVGVSAPLIDYHTKSNGLERPSYRMGKRWFYTVDQLERLRAYFDNRRKIKRPMRRAS